MASKREEKAAPRRRIAREALPESPNPTDIAMAAAASGKPLPDIARRVLAMHPQSAVPGKRLAADRE